MYVTSDDDVITFAEFSAAQGADANPAVVRGTFNYYDKLDGNVDDDIEPVDVTDIFNILDTDGQLSVFSLDSWGTCKRTVGCGGGWLRTDG